MTKPAVERRRNYYIKKWFQGVFVIKVVIALLTGLSLSMAVLLYFAGNTVTADYSGGMVSIKPTGDALMPYILIADTLAALIVIVSGVLLALLFSHKVAGPLYRFEKSLGAIKSGELTHRVRLRKDDNLKEMEEELNLLIEFFDHRIGAMKESVEGFQSLIDAYKTGDAENKETAFKKFESSMGDLVNHLSVFNTTKRRRAQH